MAQPVELALPSLACRAAIELDNLLLDRSTATLAIAELAAVISDSIANVADFSSPASTLDPTTVLVMKRAIGDSSIAPSPPQTISDLIKESGDLHRRLLRVSTDPEGATKRDPSELKVLRSFCLALSEHASNLDRSLDDLEPQRPFKR